LDHENRSVYHFEEAKLEARAELLVKVLEADAVFMRRYGSRLKSIRAYRHIYTGLHLALSGGVRRPLVHLALAAREAPESLLRRSTLGTFKHVLRNLLARR
jgi:hypothetical protein